ncbi:hypothetical protein D3C84_876560 [compost metagenome]
MPSAKNHIQSEWVGRVADTFNSRPGFQVRLARPALQVRGIEARAIDFAAAAVDVDHAVVAVEGLAQFLHQGEEAAVAAAA